MQAIPNGNSCIAQKVQLAPGNIGHAETNLQTRSRVRQTLVGELRMHDCSAPIEAAKRLESQPLDPFDVCAGPQLDDNSQFR